jgi:hypothetical protein
VDDKEEKNLIEKMVDKINDVVENIANTASDAAAHMMESDANNISAQPLIPVAADAAAMPMPLVPVARKKPSVPKKTVAAKLAPSLSGRITPTYDFPPPESMIPPVGKKKIKNAPNKTIPKAAKKTTKKSASKNSAARKSKKVSKKRFGEKIAKKKKVTKRSAKKRSRKKS